MDSLPLTLLAGLILLFSASTVRAQESDSSSTSWTDVESYDVDVPLLDDDMPVYAGNWVAEEYPLRTSALYRPLPAIRYNRVEGPVLGIGVRPLSWTDEGRRRLFGSLGYAFKLKQWQYHLGAESHVGFSSKDPADLGLKVGAAYYRTIGTNDRWKVDFLENSLASVVFRNDFFDYYGLEGWTGYAVKRLPEGFAGQVSLGYRSDRYRSLENSTTWSIFKDSPFRYNPPIEEGVMHSMLLALDAGQVDDYYDWPIGSAVRAEAEISEGFGGDFSFAQYTAGATLYRQLTDLTALHGRLLAGYSAGSLPLQKEYTLGGMGSVIGYPQNRFAGSRMFLANATFVLRDVFLLVDDLQVFASGNTGWVGGRDEALFGGDRWLGSIGGGVSFDERMIRVEVGWPLVNTDSSGPALWFRLHPTF